MPKVLYIAIIIVLLSFSTKAQKTKTGREIIDEITELISSDLEIDHDLSVITDNLEYYYQWPLNLNTAKEEDLDKLIFLNDFQVKSLLEYLSKSGPMLSIYELKLIEGFDIKTIKLLLPFVQVEAESTQPQLNVKNAFKYGKHVIDLKTFTPIETYSGFRDVSDSIRNANPEKYFPGSKHRIYTRYHFNYKNKIKWGFTAEKDPGEQFFKGNQKNGFDFYSAHLQINDVGIFKTIVLGDYQALFGQGLCMWSYISSRKSAYVMNIRKKGQGLKKYSSSDENSFLRGAGVTLKLKDVQIAMFGSYKNMDANLVDTNINNKTYFTSFDNLGAHATPNQIRKKDALNEILVGSNLSYLGRTFKVGLTAAANKYDAYYYKDTTPKNNFAFRGNQNYNMSTDFQFTFKKLHFFGEGAISKSYGTALIAGALMDFTSRFTGSLLYRNYSPNYHSLYGNGFGEGSNTQNEAGIFMGLEMHPIKRIKITAYYDFFKFPWLTTSINSPSQGTDYLLQVDYSPSQKVSMYAKFKQEIKPITTDDVNGIAELIYSDKINARYHIKYKISDNWQLANRVEISQYKIPKEKEFGYLLYQDIACSPIAAPLTIKLRYAIFETDSYDTRIYTYESNLPNTFYIPANYNKGTRTYIMAHYKILERLDFWVRYSQTWYVNQEVIGSGSLQIDGNTRSDIQFQLRLKI